MSVPNIAPVSLKMTFSILNCHSLWRLIQGPFLVKTRTHLHNVLGDDNVLMVKFADTDDRYNAGYDKIAKNGILVGLRLYCFFGEPFLNSLVKYFGNYLGLIYVFLYLGLALSLFYIFPFTCVSRHYLCLSHTYCYKNIHH